MQLLFTRTIPDRFPFPNLANGSAVIASADVDPCPGSQASPCYAHTTSCHAHPPAAFRLKGAIWSAQRYQDPCAVVARVYHDANASAVLPQTLSLTQIIGHLSRRRPRVAPFRIAHPGTRAYGPGHLHVSLPGKRPERGFKNAMAEYVHLPRRKLPARTTSLRILPLQLLPLATCITTCRCITHVRARISYSDDLAFEIQHKLGDRGSIHGSTSTRPTRTLCL